MSRLRVHSFSISLDGYGAGPDQSLEHPLGVGGEALHEWIFPTRTFQRMHGGGGGTTGVDDDFAARGFATSAPGSSAATCSGRSAAPGPTTSWKGWWGDEPPYHMPVFVLTHHPRAPLAMEGGTTFHFVTDGIEAALERAREAAARARTSASAAASRPSASTCAPG